MTIKSITNKEEHYVKKINFQAINFRLWAEQRKSRTGFQNFCQQYNVRMQSAPDNKGQ